jgi:hypothetical protein
MTMTTITKTVNSNISNSFNLLYARKPDRAAGAPGSELGLCFVCDLKSTDETVERKKYHLALPETVDENDDDYDNHDG